MDLYTQIISLVVSFVFGFFFSLFVDINYKIIYNENKFIKFLGTFLVVLLATLLYFIILRKINYAAFHVYCLLVLSIGYYLYKVIARSFKKWYTYGRKVSGKYGKKTDD